MMAEAVDWLPPLILFDAYNGDWKSYEADLYEYFKNDFILTSPFFNNRQVNIDRKTDEDEREVIFWHIISEGKVECARKPDFRRCERIRWIRKIIEHWQALSIKVWRKRKKRQIRIYLWIESYEYLVALIDRKNYYLLLTAFPVVQEHSKRKLRKEFEEFKKTNAVI